MEEGKDGGGKKPSLRTILKRWLAILFSGFVIYSMATLRVQELQQLSIFLGFTLALAFLHYPLNPGKPDSLLLLGIDLLLGALGFAIAIYVCVDYWDFIFRVGVPTQWDVVGGAVLILLVFEGARRAAGLALVIIAAVFLLYTFFGHLLPPPLSHRGYGIERITTTFFMTKNGVYGVALNVMCQFIFLFIAFGAFFGMSGGTEFFIDLATALFGRLRGGPAKVAVVSSGLMGSISGSAVANTVTTGTFTIPLMKRIGFEPHVAGAVEATASSGGALMPPVMGAAAFVMAEFLGVPYLDVCKAALIPAIVYYLAIFSVVHFYSLKIGIRGMPEEELPRIRDVFRERWMFSIPLLLLIFVMVLGYSPRVAVLYALLATVVTSWFKKETRMTPARILKALAETGMGSVMVSTACAIAGIVIGVVLLTGMGSKITTLVVTLSAGSLVVALPVVMLASMLFGMGLPTVVCYVLLASTVGPSLVNLGATPMASHLFIYYFGMLCMVTPPVAFASYAGAAIAKSDPMKTGWVAWTFALAGFLLPYMFIYNPPLLFAGAWHEILLAFATATLGVICLGAGIIGFFIRDAVLPERLLLLAASFLLIKPGWVTDVLGLACVGMTLFLQFRRGKK
ncbi:MAG: TRAP transporter permease [Deltaproteobacteria bacterium]|nr:TRAP transporter permease [Deltaproteobacteria bacterium]